MVEEIGQFLLPSQRMDVRAVALAQVPLIVTFDL